MNVNYGNLWWLHTMGSRLLDYLRVVLPLGT